MNAKFIGLSGSSIGILIEPENELEQIILIQFEKLISMPTHKLCRHNVVYGDAGMESMLIGYKEATNPEDTNNKDGGEA